MSSEKSKGEARETSETPIEWSAENEVHLFYAMRGHKPVGVSRNFHMLCVVDALANATNKDVASKHIWTHLEQLYDMETLHENEDNPFAKTVQDFSIEGNREFDELIANKIANSSTKAEKSSESDESDRNVLPKSGPKSGANSKMQDTNKSVGKTKAIESEKSVKNERKDEANKHDKNEESDDKFSKPKKMPKSVSSNANSLNKKRKTNN